MSFIDVSFVKGEWAQKIVLFVIMALCITVLEYFAGLVFIKGMKIKLWDYSSCWGNIQGIICPQYSFYWVLLSAVYYFLVHPRILEWLYWFTNHLAFCLVVGFFYGVFTVDLCYTLGLSAKIRAFATEKQIEVHYESLKLALQKRNEEFREKRRFLFQLHTYGRNFAESLREALADNLLGK
jgi:uncharacterized membrane protein